MKADIISVGILFFCFLFLYCTLHFQKKGSFLLLTGSSTSLFLVGMFEILVAKGFLNHPISHQVYYTTAGIMLGASIVNGFFWILVRKWVRREL